ncbi:hypothetical protein [Pseudooceanicola sp.]|uniref:hypothetical protein n=1 Tax=Pseudooceanicola sp. TaxID=1914328 RepID=UPI00405A399B
MTEGPFRADRGITGWCIRFGQTGYAAVNQFGQIKSWGARGEEYNRMTAAMANGQTMLGALQAAASQARADVRSRAGRYGTRNCELRGELSAAICVHLNNFDWSEVLP